MENLLPVGWVETTVGEVSTILRGVSYSKRDENKANFENACLILRGGNIQNGELLKEASDNTFVEKNIVQNQQFLKRGDVVIVGSTGSQHLLGKAAQCLEDTTDISFGAFLKTLRPSPEINTTYFGYFFQTKDYRDIIRLKGGGININNIRDGHLLELPFPLAPLSEQTRIVAALDDYMAHLRTAETALDDIPSLLRQFRQKVLDMAVSGELTEGFRENTEGVAICKTMNLSSISSITGGVTLNGKRKEMPIQMPYLRVANVYANELRLDDIKKVGVTESEIKKTLLKEGDLLVVEGNGSIDQVGRVAFWNGEIENCLHQNHIIRIRFENLVTAKLILYFLMSPDGRTQIESKSYSTSGLNTLSISKVASLKFPIPTLAEQTEIVRCVEELLHIATEIETAYDTARAELKVLPQVLLSKAFKGELLAPSVSAPLESVATLLERIKSEKARLVLAKKGGKAGKYLRKL